MKKQIRICRGHEKQVPLIYTFAFTGAEYWCPYCGNTYGFLGAGKEVELTPELEQAEKEWKKKTKKFLSAKGTLSCDYKKIKGAYVSRKNFPPEMLEKARKIVDNFRYEYETEQS